MTVEHFQDKKKINKIYFTVETNLIKTDYYCLKTFIVAT